MSSASASIPVGYKQTEIGVIPEDWEPCELEKISEFITKGATPTTYGFKWQQSGVPFLRSECVSKTGLDLSQSMYITQDANEFMKRSKIISGDILMTITGYVGRVVIYDLSEPANINQHIARIRVIPKKADSLFVFHYLSNPKVRGLFTTTTTGQAYPQTSLAQVRSAKIYLPGYDEQVKISKILSDTDSQIKALENLIQKKRGIKQGTMQELLTGKTRLAGFSGEWKVKQLGQIGEITGAGVDKKIVDGEKPVRLLNYLDVYNRSFIYSNELNHHVTAPASKATKCSVREGDIFFTPTSEVRDDIAVSAIAMEDIPDATYSYHVVRLRIDDHWDLNFRAYAFQTKAFLDQAAVLSDGSGTRYVISLPNFRKLKVLVPPKPEQQAIGQILSDIDAEISSLEQRLQKTKAIKQGMMQQLLSGQIRLVNPSTPVEVSA